MPVCNMCMLLRDVESVVLTCSASYIKAVGGGPYEAVIYFWLSLLWSLFHQMQQLGRIHSGGSPGTEIDNDDIDLEVVSSLEYMEKEAFLASGGDNGYIQSSSFQHRIQPLSMSMSTTDSALQMQLTSQPGSPHDLPQTSQSSDMLYGLEEEVG